MAEVERINNLYPSADAEANLNRIKAETEFAMNPSASYANFMRRSFDSFGRGGVQAATALRALKPTNLLSILFGRGKGFVNDLNQVAEDAKTNYRSTGYGFLPPRLLAPINDKAKAYVVAREAAKSVEDFQDRAALPIAALKVAMLAAVLGTGYTYLNKRKQRKQQEKDLAALQYGVPHAREIPYYK